MASHAPFPDVTGLRTSGPGFARVGEHCEFVQIKHETEIDASRIAAIAKDNLDHSILAAWSCILFHYGSHEASNIDAILMSDRGADSVMQVDFTEARELDAFPVFDLIDLIQQRQQQALEATDLEHGYAAFVLPQRSASLPKVFTDLKQKERADISVAVSYTVENGKLVLHLKATPAVHSEDSALLQLRQVAALLQSFSNDPTSHALSLERFDQSLKASDNLNYVHLPDPEYLDSRHTDQLETEFEYFARTRPDALALDFRFDLQDKRSAKWTYAEMNERAEKVKTLLWSHGAGSASDDTESDHIVALYLEKSPETYLSFIGVLKAGAAWCPIDTDWPASRRQALLAKSNAKIVLTHSDRVSKQLQEDLQSEDVVKNGGMKAIRLDQLDQELENVSSPPQSLLARSKDQLAYMIWTSGTTGLPKGVGIQHNAIIQAMRALRLYIPYGKDKIGTDQIRYLQYSAYNFDLSIMDCFYTWGLGGTLCSCPRDVLLQDLVDVGNSIKPTHTLLTPAVMAMTERHKVPSLKVVVSGGEKLSQVVADEWSKDCCLLNLYGPAEATLIAMNRRVPFGDKVKAPNIGVALPTVSCHALDKADRVVLKGAVGELVLGGPQLARGYVGDPGKTADKFFPHPELGRVYRTGDLVRQLNNQEFEYLGRIDDQVKINGIRIELLEINAAIKNSHELIKDSETMAFPKPGNDSEQQIINFSVLPGDPKQLLRMDEQAVQVARELQTNARDQLPSYMIPNLFVILSHFPRTSSAKIDRVALKNVLGSFDQLDWKNQLAGDDSADGQDGVPSEAEEVLRKTLSELCNVAPDKIGRKTPFTSVGLDSIRAMTFSQRLVQQGYPVSVLNVTQYPTLLSLGKKLSDSAESTDDTAQLADKLFADIDAHYRSAILAPLRKTDSDIDKILPCTPLQEGMLAESQRDPLSYRIQRQYALPRECNEQKLRAALQQAVDGLDSLRTTFVDIGTLDVPENDREWPFRSHLLQVVWKQSSVQIQELEVNQSENIADNLLAASQTQLHIEPFSTRPPVGFILAHHGENKYLVVVAHHSTYDARSLGILEDWLETLYDGATPPKTLQFSSALSHILPLTQESAQQKQDVWTKAFESYPKGMSGPFPPLLTNLPSKTEESNVHQSEYIDASVPWSQIEATCRQLGVSSRPLLQAAWARVLAAYLDTQHVIIGDSVSGRSLSAELDQVYGPVLSTVPVPFILQRGQTADQLIKDTDAFHTLVMESQHTDLGAIRKMLELTPGEPLFHSVFVLEPAQKESHPSGTDFHLQRVADLGVATEHALGVEVLPQADGSVKLGLSWHKALISEAFGQTMLAQFDKSLKTICNATDSASTVRWDSETESLFSITPETNLPDASAIANRSVVESIYRGDQASARNAVEVYVELAESHQQRSANSSMTYEELDMASNNVATRLRDLPHNSVVGVCLERSLESYIVPLAVLKAGHAYLPLDETLPLDRKTELLRDSNAALLIGSAKTANGIQKVDTLLTDSDELKQLVSSSKSDAIESESDPEDVAFIIYTSGSTGKPKGCLLTYKNLSATIEAFRLTFEKHAPGSFDKPARFLARSAEAFDVHLLEIFLSLRVGATIVTGPRAVVHEDIGRTMRVLEVTHACVVPSLFFVNGERIKPAAVPSLRALIIGGEPLTQDVCELWGSEGEERPVLLNAYGPSEATIGTSIARVHKTSRPSNIGAPFLGTRYAALKEEHGQFVPTLKGEPGELFIGGLQVAKGYLNRPELESFLWWNDQWMYRTGDLVRLHPSNEAEYLGRIDGSQVKVRGARLELGEVDAALTKCLPHAVGSTGSTVTILSDHPKVNGAPRLIAFFATSGKRDDTKSVGEPKLLDSKDALDAAAELRRLVRSSLPQYMIPSLVLPLAFIPISALSGKADRKSLEALYKSVNPSDFSAGGHEEARDFTEREQKVATLVSQTARLDPNMALTPTLDLITAGLDSLSVITLSSRLRKIGYNVSPASLMDQPTIEAIVQNSSDKGSVRDYGTYDELVRNLTRRAQSLPASKDMKIETAIPCVPLQEALISQALTEGSSAPRYITTIVIDVHGEHSAETVQKAWCQTLAEHQIYRTTFAEIDRKLVQVVISPQSYQTRWETSSQELPQGDNLDAYHHATANDVVAKLNTEPPLRLKLWRADRGLAITLTCSHAIYDGDSLKNLLAEVSARLRDTTSETNPAQFSLAAREVGTQSAQDSIAFWKQTLQGFSRTPIPNLTGIRPEKNMGGASELTVTSQHNFADLERSARAKSVTVHSILLEAFCRLVGLYAGEKDVTVGLVLSGRTLPIPGIESMHGPLVTTAPFRLNDESGDRVRKTHKLINQILPFQHVSLPQLMKSLDLDQVPFESLFSYLGSSTSTASDVFIERSTVMERDYPLALEVSVLDDHVQLHLAFDTKRIPDEHASLMISHYDQVLGNSIAKDSQSSAETHLSILNKDCYVPTHESETFLARFGQHCSSTPKAPAIAFTSSMDEKPTITTYEELHRVSNVIAGHLVQCQGQIVGVHLTKDGPELFAAILAVWKAGKTYLPLDPTLPKERLEYMVESVGNCPTITTKATAENLAGSSCQLLDLDELLKPSATEQTLPSPRLDTPCYLLFTSGSTGKPKAVQVSQRALAAALYSWERILPFTKDSRFLQLASIGFDVSLIELCMPLSLGFSLGTAPKNVLLEDLVTSIKHLGVTIADLPAALAGTVHPDDVQLEWLMSGGDVIDSKVIETWNEAGRKLINAWGPTEATIGNTLGEIKGSATRNMVGKIYPTSSMYVLDESSTTILPYGAIGELAVGGPQVADMYYGREDLTAEKFIKLDDGSRVYRTGDLGRFLHDSSVECLGRIGSDRQVKINGQRMELDEVSAVLSAQQGVQDADVQYLKHSTMGSKQLVAFVAPKGSSASSEIAARDDDNAVELSTKLEGEALKRLAPYMIPTHWIITNRALPLSHNNKTDHKALAAFYESMDASALRSFGSKREGAMSSSTWTESEEKLRGILADFCSIAKDDIGKNTSFHRLGIDSITAIQLVKSLRGAGFALTVAELMSTPYIAALADKQSSAADSISNDDSTHQWTERLSSELDTTALKLSSTDVIESVVPCTPLQTGMIAQTLARSGKLYFHHHRFEVAHTPQAVVSAWKELTAYLDILRTTFHATDGDHPWVQAVHSQSEPTVVEHDGQFTDQAGLETIVGQPKFDNEEAFMKPPHVLHLWKNGQSTTVLLSIHHALYDGSSLPQLLDDFGTILSGQTSKLPNHLPFNQLAPSLLSEDANVAHWTNELNGFRPQLLRETSVDEEAATLVERDLALSVKEIEAKCRPLGVSMQVLCCLVFAKILALETDARDICFGQLFGLLDVVADADTAVGPAFNTVATRVRFDDLDASNKSLLQTLQKANDSGRPHRKAALREVQQKLKQGPLFDALFDYQRDLGQDDQSVLKPLELSDDGDSGTQYTLNVAFVQGPSKMSVVAKAASSKYDQPSLDSIVHQIDDILADLPNEMDKPVSHLPKSVDRSFPSALPPPIVSQNGHHPAAASPLSEDGKKLASIISTVSGTPIEDIGGDTRLVTLGLDSISAIKIASQARRAGLKLGMGQVVSGETINSILSQSTPSRPAANGSANHAAVDAKLAKRIEAGLGVKSAQIERVLPLLSGQLFWLATWAQTQGGGGYSFAYRLPSAAEAKVRSTWAKMRQLQPVLRTAFLLDQSEAPQQVVLTADSVNADTAFTAIDSSARSVEDVVAAQAARGWKDLSKPPVQLTLVGDVLVFSLHHVLYDAFSIDLLVRDFASLYAGGDLASSPAWIEAVDHINSEHDASRSEQHWHKALAGAAPGVLAPTGTADKEEFLFEPRAVVLPDGLDAKLRTAGVSLPSVIVAAWSSLLTDRLGLHETTAPLFGMFHLGRSSAFDSIETVQGPLLSVLPVAVPIASNTAADLVDGARHAAEELRSRAQFEQSDLVQVHNLAGLPLDRPSYNTFLNLLISSEDATGDDARKATALEAVDLGHPTDLPAQDQTTSLPAAGKLVDQYASVLQPDVNVDIVFDPAADALAIGVKARTSVVPPAALPQLITDFAARISLALSAL